MKTLSTKVQPATMEEIEEYAGEIEESRSAATRDLIRRGLRAEQESQDHAENRINTITSGFLIIGLLLIFGVGQFTGSLFGIGFEYIGLYLTMLAILMSILGEERLMAVYRRVSTFRD